MSLVLPRVSIIIRALNEAEHLGRLLEGIARQNYGGVTETILVDSGSKDDTVAIARRHGCKIVGIRPADFSFGRAINLGAEHARGELALLVSAHCFPMHAAWIENFVAAFENQHVTMAYGMQRGVSITKFSEHAIFAKWFPDHDLPPSDLPFANNANSMFRLSAWRTHPFDETLTGFEDIAWAKTQIEQGNRIHYLASAGVYHVHHESYRTVYRRYYREALAYRRIYVEQHFSTWRQIACLVMNLGGDVAMAWRQGCLVRAFLSIVLFRLMHFLGTWAGYRYRVPISRKMAYRLYYPRHLRRILREEKYLHGTPEIPTPNVF